MLSALRLATTAALLTAAALPPSSIAGASKTAAAQWLAQGRAALAAGAPSRARDAFETALAADPASVAAYLGLAEAARAQGLPGEAIKHYRSALDLEPTDLEALAGHAEALAERGATARAGVDLARIEKLCGPRPCPEAARVRSAIALAAAQSATKSARTVSAPIAGPRR